MDDPVLVRDRNQYVPHSIHQHFFKPVPEFILVYVVINLPLLLTIELWHDKPIGYHQVGSFERHWLHHKTDWRLTVVDVDSVNHTQVVVHYLPRAPTDTVAAWNRPDVDLGCSFLKCLFLVETQKFDVREAIFDVD